MVKKEHIVRYTDEELRIMQERGESKSDWAKAAAMTDAEVEAAIADDPDEAGMIIDWSSLSAELPPPESVLK